MTNELRGMSVPIPFHLTKTSVNCLNTLFKEDFHFFCQFVSTKPVF